MFLALAWFVLLWLDSSRFALAWSYSSIFFRRVPALEFFL